MKKLSSARRFAPALAVGIMLSATSLAHGPGGHGDHQTAKPPPHAVLQLDQAREAAARYLDVDAALAAGYADIGVFMPNMGWHYLNEGLLDGEFDWTEPELLVYVDDPCSAKRRLVAVEYAVPLSLAKRAPAGFVGRADRWDANQTFQIWTLHAWVYEFNPHGVFAPMNPRVP
jgi:hypothetical protein